ncbi:MULTISPECIES: hypothetical protein [Acinetobacter]|uniref:Uncharacterized protein n=1 Tax=Acinetobacter parvus DSM 16617 = CIP 108168 TaxID=981333 RepID=N8QEP3_9GAMM|nr:MULTISPECIES: hypothetical protein [Acinetobacter]ENU37020.1 hypothetical protein F988_00778 [Acinetobacter parvus DSM 16617 = CIP 108168]ENU84831.1 hypothetical protein F974_00049 [Acinetobacter sp. CIP 102159]ENU90307.1 hypothetical protein F972_00377 [Acinetobacter sp. CIP 102529]ENU97071.1 hypothetical protein F970_00171 [Acinetobacter sp. CIP 102082]MCU4395320.1 hypothetical protein [Acinetobacter parvus]
MKKFNDYEVENSIQSEIDFLKLIINKPQKYINDNYIKTAISSQKNMAKYVNNEYGIISLSLNTHKLYVNKYSNMTYTQFNELRIKALSSIITSPITIRNKTKELEKENNNLKINNLTLIKIIYDLKSIISNLALNTKNQYIIDETNNKLRYFEKLLNYVNEDANYE